MNYRVAGSISYFDEIVAQVDRVVKAKNEREAIALVVRTTIEEEGYELGGDIQFGDFVFEPYPPETLRLLDGVEA